MRAFAVTFFLGFLSCPSIYAQQGDNPGGSVPIYRLTVERRAIQAVNYGHRSGPTKIDFRGTALLGKAKGEARIQGRSGTVEVDASFSNLEPPTQFGHEYLTYVLWAITPDGRPVNLGEVVADSSNKAKLKATTHLQAFGLIISAEPYFAVTQPSNVVVLENVLRPDTAGKAEEVEAKYELLPRGTYSSREKPVEIHLPASAANSAKPVSTDQYEALLAVYEAQNALQIARAQGAEQYATDTLQKAEQLYQQARTLNDGKASESKRVVTLARESAQTAEDARTIALKHKQPPANETRPK